MTKDKRKIKLQKITCQRCKYSWSPAKEIVNRCANKRCRSFVWWKPKKTKQEECKKCKKDGILVGGYCSKCCPFNEKNFTK